MDINFLAGMIIGIFLGEIILLAWTVFAKNMEDTDEEPGSTGK